MKYLVSGLLSLLFLVILVALLAGFWFSHTVARQGPLQEDTAFMVEAGQSGYRIAQELAKEGFIRRADIFYLLLRVQPATIKAGEYSVPSHSSMRDILALLQNGAVINRQFTLPEGMTVRQAVRLLEDVEHLEGSIDVDSIPEGSLLPETYSYTRGDTRQSLVERMQKAHRDLVEKLWQERDPSLPLKSINEMVTLASIVEKETGVAHERARIAGLFYNRLSIGMKLQTDPTVVYVITDRLGHMEGKPLYRRHLEVDSPYNTYKVTGLPPAPIANPGRASLEAVMNPEKHDYLYFVADGTGGHQFSKTLRGHNDNVREWRKIKRNLATPKNPAAREKK